MTKSAEVRVQSLAESVVAQREVIDAIRYDLTEWQAASANHNEQEALQAELDRYTAIAADLDRVLEKLAA
jgi:hypothetical protein